MAETIKLEAQTRTVSGTAEAGRLRRSGILPAVVYNAENGARSIQIETHGFAQMLRHHASESLLLDLSIDGAAPIKVLMKEVQHHALTDDLLHVDFLEVSLTEKMRANVSIDLVGDPVGVTLGGGIMEHHIRDVEVECLPMDLVESIKVDVSGLDVGGTLQVGDLDFGDGIAILTDPDITVVSILAPTLADEADEESDEEDGAAPESSEAASEESGETKSE